MSRVLEFLESVLATLIGFSKISTGEVCTGKSNASSMGCPRDLRADMHSNEGEKDDSGPSTSHQISDFMKG